jgi:hypothetical protein
MAWTIDRKHDHFAVVTMNTNKVNAQNAAFFGGRARALALSLSMDLTDAAAKGRASQIRIWVAKSTLSWGCKGGCGAARPGTRDIDRKRKGGPSQSSRPGQLSLTEFFVALTTNGCDCG